MGMKRKSKMSEMDKVLRVLERATVYVGIPGTDVRDGGEINNAALGYLFEYGAPEINMPERPWLTPGIDTARERIAKTLAEGAARAMVTAGFPNSVADAGKAEAVKALHSAGLIAVNAVRARIRAGIAPALSDRTVYARLHRKKNRRSPGPMTPLIDTGSFIRSVTYIVKA